MNFMKFFLKNGGGGEPKYEVLIIDNHQPSQKSEFFSMFLWFLSIDIPHLFALALDLDIFALALALDIVEKYHFYCFCPCPHFPYVMSLFCPCPCPLFHL